MTDDERQKAALEHAWRYFALHAGQRISMFNYFIVVFGLVSAGMASCLRTNGVMLLAGAALGLGLIVIAFIFWKLDERTSFLVKQAERVLQHVEGSVLEEQARIFSDEARETGDQQLLTKGATKLWTYGQSFRTLFGLTATIGVAGIGFAILRYTMER
jgi:hypothetical protein